MQGDPHLAFDRAEKFIVTDPTNVARPLFIRPPEPTHHISEQWGIALATNERGTKRTCPVTGKKFYDLNKDPVVSPYTGKSYPVTYFEVAPEKPAKPAEKPRAAEAEEVDVDHAAAAAGAEVISLSDAEPAPAPKADPASDDDDDDDTAENIPEVADVEVDEELGDDDSFLETDDDDDIDFNVPVDEEDDR